MLADCIGPQENTPQPGQAIDLIQIDGVNDDVIRGGVRGPLDTFTRDKGAWLTLISMQDYCQLALETLSPGNDTS